MHTRKETTLMRHTGPLEIYNLPSTVIYILKQIFLLLFLLFPWQ